MRYSLLITAVSVAASLAAQNTYPLPASAALGGTTINEGTAPFLAPLRMTQTLVTDRSRLLPMGLPASFINWDMVAFDPSSRFIFVPIENFAAGAGVFRYDTLTGAFVTLMLGNGNGNAARTADPAAWNPATDEYTSIDPCSWTPWGTIIVGEETTGGRLFEITNPLSPNGPFSIRWHSKIPAMAHEGMRFDANGNLYVIDEFNSGSIYKYVPATPGDLRVGQTFVLRVDGYHADPDARPAENWNSTQNRLTSRFGPATWVPITDATGNALTTANPFAYVTTTGGRDAADEVGGTPYGRPEDLDIGVLANGNQAIYCAVTSENRVLSIELTSSTTAIVREFVNFDTINLATGIDVNPLQNDPYTSPGAGTALNNPDNIAIDAFGNVYVIEDNEPGDIWKTVDSNRDGVAEAMGLFLALGVSGSEPTGMIFDPNDPYRFIVNVQHPSSGNVALWSFRTRPYAGSNQDIEVYTGVNTAPTSGPGEFVKTAVGNDIVNLRLDSPNGSLYGVPFAVLLQGFATGSGAVPFLPPLWVNPRFPILTLTGGPTGQFVTVMPQGGYSVGLLVPPGLAGLSVMVQGIGVDNGALLLTNAHEVVLR